MRAPVTLAIGQVALRNTPLMLEDAAGADGSGRRDRLLAEAFDMLEEDLEEEQFFVDRPPRLLGRPGRLADAKALPSS